MVLRKYYKYALQLKNLIYWKPLQPLSIYKYALKFNSLIYYILLQLYSLYTDTKISIPLSKESPIQY